VPPDGPAASTAPDDPARTAGRGGLAITFAKIYFILQGLVQQVLLPRVLGLDGYGALSSVLGAASIAYNPIVTTSIQGVSRAVAGSTDAERPAIVRRTFAVHAVLAMLAATSFYLAVPSITGFMRAPHVEAPLRLVSLVLLFYGLYAPLIGVLNGQRRFVAQATFDVVFATLRTAALVLGGAALAPSGRGVLGSVGGFVAMASVIAVAAVFVVGLGRPGRAGPTPLGHIGFIAPLLAGQVLLNLLLQADLTLLRRFSGAAAAAQGLATSAADPLVGAYRATQLFSFLPYQLLVSVTFILFPMLATAARAGDRAAVSRYVTTGVRVALLVAGLLVSVTSGLSGPLIRLVYTPEAAALGERSMQVLTLGFGAFAILGVLTAVLASLGRERASAAVTAVAFALVVTLCFARLEGVPFGEELLFRTATSTATGLAFATLCAAWLVHRTAGAVARVATVARVFASAGAAIFVARWLPQGGKIVTLAASAGIAALYVVLLVVTRELGRDDTRLVASVLKRRTP
jgi:stage V sporulation protein B